MSATPVIVIENDQSLRLLQAFLDRETNLERDQALADYLAHDLADFPAWLHRARERAKGAYPACVRIAESRKELVAHLSGADAIVIESLGVGPEELAVADRLKCIQQHGMILRNIDLTECDSRGIKVFPLRRRGNMTAAEHIFSLMLALSRKTLGTSGLITQGRMEAAGYRPKFFDRRFSPNANWARIGGLRSLHGTTLGILGFGEIGREVALRGRCFGMQVLYYQRSRALDADERRLDVEYVSMEQLLSRSDWLCVLVPGTPATRDLLDRDRLRTMKPGACLINVSRADTINRDALVEALTSGHLGGLGQDAFYEEPGREDDPLLALPNVIITPRLASQPRHNALEDTAEMMMNLASQLA
jgi:glyoxylate reductase